MSEPVPPELLGGWRLIAMEELEGARGVAFFHVGMISVHIHAPGAPRRELRNIAYFGFFTVHGVDRSGETVRGELQLQLEGGFPVEVLDGDAPRSFEVAGDTLVLGSSTFERIH